MAVRSTLLVHVAGTASTTAQTVFTCPPGRTALAKDIALRNRSASSAVLSLFIDDGSTLVMVMRRVTASQELVESPGRFLVLEPGDRLTVVASTSSTEYSLSVSGALLLGEPE